MSSHTPNLLDRIPGIVWFFAGMLLASLVVGLLLLVAHHGLNSEPASLPLSQRSPSAAPPQPCPDTPITTSLPHLIACDDLAAARRLLTGGGHPDQTDTRAGWAGRTALHHAAVTGNEAAVRLLLDAGADPAAADSEGNTPLHVLPEAQDSIAAAAIGAQLLKAGAAHDATNAAGDAALTLLERAPARLIEHQALAKLLHRAAQADETQALQRAETTLTRAPSAAGQRRDIHPAMNTVPATVVRASAAPAREDPALAAKRDIRNVLRTWTTAWSAKDMDTYLAQYHANFSPSDGRDRAQWQQQRHERIARKTGRISVFLRDIVIEPKGDGAIASFIQDYDSGNYRDSTRKQLSLTRTGKGWQILREDSID